MSLPSMCADRPASLDRRAARRIVLLLAVCQATWMTGTALNMTISALAGQMIAVDKSFATLPLAMQFVGTMAATIPASLLMRRYGRRVGLSLGAGLGILGAVLSVYAVAVASLALLAAGGFLLGAFNASAQYYRFAAADVADEAYRSRAISYVLAGGLVAAVCGPELAKLSKDLLAPITFAGGFVVIAALGCVTLTVLQGVRIPTLSAEERADSGRPLGQIARQPVFAVAVLGAMVGYGTMAFIMTATPLAVIACGYVFDDSAFVLQWHAIGMFAPAFFTGHLIRRFGVLNIMLCGALLNIACVLINLSGVNLAQFWAGLVLLGIGWNFLFVGATTLLSETHTPQEKAKVQALNDFLVFGTVSVASLSAGALQHVYGWSAVNLGVAPMLAVATVATAWMIMLRRRRAAAPAG